MSQKQTNKHGGTRGTMVRKKKKKDSRPNATSVPFYINQQERTCLQQLEKFECGFLIFR